MSISRHMAKSLRTPTEVAQNLGRYCKAHSVLTRGYVKIGRTPRGLRGIVAAKDILANDSVIVVPHTALLSYFDALRDVRFKALWESGAVPFDPYMIQGRVGATFLHLHQVVLAYYMAHLILADEFQQVELLKYLDFLPRGEAKFEELGKTLDQALDHCEMSHDMQGRIAKANRVSVETVRGTVLWCLAMVISRSVPVQHRPTLERIMEKTPFEALLEHEPEQSKYSVPVMAPLLDLLNHDAEENVMIAVPDAEMQHGRCLIARSVRDIAQGEEVVMTYGAADPYLLRLFYGIGE